MISCLHGIQDHTNLKSLVSSYGRMMCLFKRSLQVWQKVTLHLASWSSRTTWHQGAHLSQSPKAISLHSENSETVHFMYISFIYQSKKWRVFCWCPLWTKAIYLSLQYFISSSPFVKRKLPGASRRWAPWFVVHPTGPGRPTSRLENLDLPSFTGTQKKVPGRNIRSFPRACSRLHSPSKSLDC